MSHFNLERDICQATKMDDKLQGPVPRWKRKALETSTISNASTSMVSTSMLQAPQVTLNQSSLTNKKKTPMKNESGDRMIPNRRAMDFEKANYAISTKENENASAEASDYTKAVQQQLNLDLSNYRILAYRDKAPSAATASGPNRILYSSSKGQSVTKSNRYIPSRPDKILDAPGIVDDFYLNLLDWGVRNVVAVALGGNLFLWNAQTGTIEHLIELPNQQDCISAVRFCQDGFYIAVGLSTNAVELWDIEGKRLLRTLNGHTNRVGSISWNNHVCSSGARSGVIMHSDVRVPEHQQGTVNAHMEEICGLEWSPDGKYLASGGNDNQLHFWPQQISGRVRPVHSFNDHMAGIKAISWCPFQKGVVATGGGTADRCIRIWNVSSGSMLSCTDTKSQVCGLLWSEQYKELVSAHGYSNYELNIWKYAGMRKVGELRGHSSRILNVALSPDGTTVMSASADETLRSWTVFPFDKTKEAQANKSSKDPNGRLTALHNLR
ncbi:cell division cycle 20.3, cofactor of APC complex [Galendromus occidentalis]|uniref:Cell division cycle 20.3, cofactor of APC complex n=1 Tax=Galendromus occidentalis TaxID=34638 RepID=A0AAJ6QWG5_9ACAR|nr:cell division cycle 20.3, cofactor of APC complex [Galendromus occidentalis]